MANDILRWLPRPIAPGWLRSRKIPYALIYNETRKTITSIVPVHKQASVVFKEMRETKAKNSENQK